MKKTWPVLLVLLLMATSTAQAQSTYATISISTLDNTNFPQEACFVPTASGTATITNIILSVTYWGLGGSASVAVVTNLSTLDIDPIYSDLLVYNNDYPLGTNIIIGTASFEVSAGTTYYLVGSGSIYVPFAEPYDQLGQGEFRLKFSFLFPATLSNGLEALIIGQFLMIGWHLITRMGAVLPISFL